MTSGRREWSTPLHLSELSSNESVWSVYEPDLRSRHPQFKETWWLKTKGVPNMRHFALRSEEDELARVMVKVRSAVPSNHVGPYAGRPATEILYLEVADDARYHFSGIGRNAVTAVSALFDAVVFAKATTIPGGFWARLGWHEYPPIEDPRTAWRVFVRPD